MIIRQLIKTLWIILETTFPLWLQTAWKLIRYLHKSIHLYIKRY